MNNIPSHTCAVCGFKVSDTGLTGVPVVMLSSSNVDVQRAEAIFGDLSNTYICMTCYLLAMGVKPKNIAMMPDGEPIVIEVENIVEVDKEECADEIHYVEGERALSD